MLEIPKKHQAQLNGPEDSCDLPEARMGKYPQPDRSFLRDLCIACHLLGQLQNRWKLPPQDAVGCYQTMRRIPYIIPLCSRLSKHQQPGQPYVAGQ